MAHKNSVLAETYKMGKPSTRATALPAVPGPLDTLPEKNKVKKHSLLKKRKKILAFQTIDRLEHVIGCLDGLRISLIGALGGDEVGHLLYKAHIAQF